MASLALSVLTFPAVKPINYRKSIANLWIIQILQLWQILEINCSTAADGNYVLVAVDEVQKKKETSITSPPKLVD